MDKSEILNLMVKDCQDAFAEFKDPGVHFGMGLALGILVKHLEEIMENNDGIGNNQEEC